LVIAEEPILRAHRKVKEAIHAVFVRHRARFSSEPRIAIAVCRRSGKPATPRHWRGHRWIRPYSVTQLARALPVARTQTAEARVRTFPRLAITRKKGGRMSDRRPRGLAVAVRAAGVTLTQRMRSSELSLDREDAPHVSRTRRGDF
jgi:hypothetical protein